MYTRAVTANENEGYATANAYEKSIYSTHCELPQLFYAMEFCINPNSANEDSHRSCLNSTPTEVISVGNLRRILNPPF